MLVTIACSELEAQISTMGAELVRLRDRNGHDLLWDGNPAIWTGKSPLLFPIVGRVRNDRARIMGQEYGLKQHGFARTSLFGVITKGEAFCHFRLSANAATRAQYPFEFGLDVIYGLEGSTLLVQAVVMNAGRPVMPVSFGFHPAFRWPLPYDGAREAHEIRFEVPEPEPTRRSRDGLIETTPHPTPVTGNRLVLGDHLFDTGAIVFDQLNSQLLSYGVPGQRSIRVAFPGLPHLGIWTKPGAGFICIEPWHGYADPENFIGEFAEKPGIALIGPGEVRTFEMAISLATV
ncbi:aldose 1-epimerase family protein [Microvirga guangxiensis]|uniref:Galactose mutarotase n=1 Tax=Microvirga guangxiensis TaxID=549386 RepID=A0A1G5CDY8_9HYPH|nr:aldose 1-epimerase family protein [Microvirga guangxiensis]SCY00643.1 Galactose mutarotase [Microvirga guangxiensis]